MVKMITSTSNVKIELVYHIKKLFCILSPHLFPSTPSPLINPSFYCLISKFKPYFVCVMVIKIAHVHVLNPSYPIYINYYYFIFHQTCLLQEVIALAP